MKPLHIIAATRTPFAKAGTTLAALDAVDLGRAAVVNLLTQTGLDPAIVDEVLFGCVGQPPHAQNIARVIALRSGLPEAVPAMTVHRNCASGLEALTTAHQRLAAGQGQVFIVGGTESMSNMPFYFPAAAVEKFAALNRAKSLLQKTARAAAFRPADFAPVIGLQLGLTDPISTLNMGQTAELLAREFHISRDLQDAFAMRSHLRAAAAAADLHHREISPVYLPHHDPVLADNGTRADSTTDKLARLRPLFDPRYGTVTAGNSSQLTDGAVALLVCGDDALRDHGWTPLGTLTHYAATGCDPARMGLGPVRAIDAVLHRSGFTLADFDLVEINEAFAAQVLAVLKALSHKDAARQAGLDAPLGDLDPARVNPSGGAIALGHPVGASGARLVQTALNQLHLRHQKRALVTLCVGGGQGVAAILESN
jgi:acetyl-CoA acetyltransferase family protein